MLEKEIKMNKIYAINHCTGKTLLLNDEPQKVKDLTKKILNNCLDEDVSYEQINTALYHADEVLYEKA